MGLWRIRFFLDTPFSAYMISIVTSFVMTLFLVSYFSLIYRNIKNDDEEAFLILREIPTVLGRMIVFGFILLTASSQREFFFLPIVAIGILVGVLVLNRRHLRECVY